MIGDANKVAGKLNEYTLILPRGLRVRIIDEGHGPLLLLLHGNPDNADEWKTLIGLLKNDFRCIAPDLPGYGRKEGAYALPTQFDYSCEAQIGFVDAILAQLDIQDKFTLVVHGQL